MISLFERSKNKQAARLLLNKIENSASDLGVFENVQLIVEVKPNGKKHEIPIKFKCVLVLVIFYHSFY